MAADPADRRRLARILGMLGSEHAGERASAALQAEAFRKRHGMTWEEMLALPAVEVVVEPVWTPPPERSPEWTIPPEWLSPRPGPWKRRWYKTVKGFHTTCEVIVLCMLVIGCVAPFIPALHQSR
jgi:hypothetical protein